MVALIVSILVFPVMQLSAERVTTLTWHAVGPFTNLAPKVCNSPDTDGLSVKFYEFFWAASTTPSKLEHSPLGKDAGS